MLELHWIINKKLFLKSTTTNLIDSCMRYRYVMTKRYFSPINYGYCLGKSCHRKRTAPTLGYIHTYKYFARFILGYIREVYASNSMAMISWHPKHPTVLQLNVNTWWRHQLETFSALLALCAGNSPVTGEFPAQRPVTRSFDVFFDLSMNKWLSKQSWGWWSETPSRPSWHHCNERVAYELGCCAIFMAHPITLVLVTGRRKHRLALLNIHFTWWIFK